MKKLLFSLVLLMGAFTFANAQAVEMAASKKSCSKSCAKACSSSSTAAAAKLAAMDETIESKTCSKTGALSYYRTSVCPMSGATTTTEVKYSTASKAFVNAAPSEVASVAKKVSMETTGTPAKKACSKSCSKTCAKGKKAATTSTEAAPRVKLVSSNQ